MIFFSTITMRDLIRNYRLIIKNKNRDSESDSEPLMSSSSSSYGATYSGVFRPDSYCTESEDDVNVNTKSCSSTPYSINKVNQSFTLPSERHYCKSNLIRNMDEELQKSPSIFIDDPCLFGLSNDLSSSMEKSIQTSSLESGNGKNTQNSLITIFSVWNTTMGSSLLAMAWGFEKAGLLSGIFINIIIAALSLYTAYILLSINEKHGIVGENFEVPELCRLLLGRWAEMLAKMFSIIVLLGANIVYYILMSNFLYNLVHFFYDFVEENGRNDTIPSAICPRDVTLSFNETSFISKVPIQISSDNLSTFDNIWDLYSTVPIFMTLVMFPLLNFRSPTFFTKFNSLGTLSVCYLLVFVAVKAANWGVNITDWTAEMKGKPTFCILSGMLSLGYFIHNIIISLMKNNKHQENNGRDLTIAFCLITFTYIFIGAVFYISFPLSKTCIEDNIFNNFPKGDTMTLVARFLLLFQLFTVFPLISFMLRNDIITNLAMISKKFFDYSRLRVIIINAVVVSICILFACFLPRIGTLIRYTGALSGLVYIFLLPSLLKMASLKKEKRLTKTKQIFFISIILIGFTNLFMQFLVSDK